MMKKGIIIAAAALSLAACKENKSIISDAEAKDTLTSTTQDKEENEVPDMHNSQNSLDWAGTYEGTLPCADCPGIKTVVLLNNDNTFTVTSEYLDRKLKTEDKGEVMWHDGSVVHLKGKETDIKLKVGENQLFYLDKEGNEIDGPLKEQYILNKK